MSTSNSYMHTFPSWYPLANMTQYASRYEVKSIQAWYKLDQIFTCENIRSSQRWNHKHIKPTWKYQTCKSTLEVIHARQHARKYTWILIKQIKHASPKWKSTWPCSQTTKSTHQCSTQTLHQTTECTQAIRAWVTDQLSMHHLWVSVNMHEQNNKPLVEPPCVRFTWSTTKPALGVQSIWDRTANTLWVYKNLMLTASALKSNWPIS